MKTKYTVLGIMSGTSLDGLDLCLCEFYYTNEKFSFRIINSQTITYEHEILSKLKSCYTISGIELIRFHKEYGDYIGKKSKIFLKNKQKPDFIASHGHTVFHRPQERLTFQIGDGAFIAAASEITCISDFRNLDTALSGQGAPLVPIGDKYLFSEYKFCLNLGGFANISFDTPENKRIAFDICPVNIIANKFSEILGSQYDKDGDFGASGKICKELLSELNQIEFYKLKHPKSLGFENVEKTFLPIFSKYIINENDKLRTLYEHISIQISKILNENYYRKSEKVLITGGGAYNKFLISLIQEKTEPEIHIPEPEIIEFKEALIFAFLGVLRFENINNCLSSVTGALSDNSSGIINFL